MYSVVSKPCLQSIGMDFADRALNAEGKKYVIFQQSF